MGLTSFTLQFLLAAMSSTVSWPSEMISHRTSNCFCSNRMVTGHHDNLNTSRSAFQDSVWYSSSWGINHGHETDKAKAGKGEVFLIRVKWISLGVLVGGQHEVAEAKDTLSQASELHVSRLKGVLPVLGERPLRAVDHNGAAALEDPLGSTFHHHEVALLVGVLRLVD